MSLQDQNNRNAILERYINIWNETDATCRRNVIRELWEENGVQFTGEHEYRGYTELEERVASAHEEFVQKGGFVFKLAGTDGHHNALKLVWDMVPASGGEVAGTGIIFLVLGDDGRISLDYQF